MRTPSLRTLGLATLTLCGLLSAAGCSDGALEFDHGTIREAHKHVHQSELIYVQSAQEAQQRFGEDGVAEFAPERAFYGASVMMTVDGELELEYSYRDLEGVWSDWESSGMDWSEDKYHNLNIEVPDGATGLLLRSRSSFEFIRVEFSQQLHAEDLHDFIDDDYDGEDLESVNFTQDQVMQLGIAVSGRWVPPSSVVNRSNGQRVGYDDAPAWNGGKNCSGTFSAGARDLGNYLVANFGGAKYFQGYNCRKIGNSSKMSLHGTGRAIDVFIPLDRGQADNTLGDPVAHWLMENAEAIGIQFIVWDRSSWSPSRSTPKTRQYSGAHPHHDHLHIELTKEGAARATQWFRNRGATPSPVTPQPTAPSGSCDSKTLGGRVAHGEAVQVNYGSSCGGSCSWFACNNGSWACRGANPGSASKTHAHSSCQQAPSQPAPAPSPQAATCYSKTLNQSVSAGHYVQMPYQACASNQRCQWAQCDSQGNWQCKALDRHAPNTPSAQCSAPAAQPAAGACNSSTLGRKVNPGTRVQMAYTSCGGTCRWAECNNSQWTCVSGPKSTNSYSHASCR